MAVQKENYIQIPLQKCSGDKGKFLEELCSLLIKNGYTTNKHGGILTIVKENQKDPVTKVDKEVYKNETF